MRRDRDLRRDLICMLLLVIIATIAAIVMAPDEEGHAETITGEIPLAGIGKALSDYYDRGGQLIDPDELDMLASLIYLENGNNSEYCQYLTGSVVLNRVACEWYPDTIREVIYQSGQYETASRIAKVKAPQSCRNIAKALLIGGSIAPKDVVFQAMFRQGTSVYYTENGEYFCTW